MPEKEAAELRLLCLLFNSPLQTEVTFVRMKTHQYRNISAGYLQKYYRPFSQIQGRFFDGMSIPGAPVEIEEVDYWEELARIMERSKSHVTSTMHIRRGAQAGLYYHYGIEKNALPGKLSGDLCHGHPEYETGTLASEYQRHLRQGISPDIPENYFPGDNPSKTMDEVARPRESAVFQLTKLLCVSANSL